MSSLEISRTSQNNDVLYKHKFVLEKTVNSKFLLKVVSSYGEDYGDDEDDESKNIIYDTVYDINIKHQMGYVDTWCDMIITFGNVGHTYTSKLKFSDLSNDDVDKIRNFILPSISKS